MQFHPHTVQLRTTTPLGPVRLAASPTGLAGVWFEGQRHEPGLQLHGPAAWPQAPGHALLQEAAQQLQQYLAGQRAGFDLPLDLSGGTPFQQAVWRALLAIGRGATTSLAGASIRRSAQEKGAGADRAADFLFLAGASPATAQASAYPVPFSRYFTYYPKLL